MKRIGFAFVVAGGLLGLGSGALAQDKPCAADAQKLCPGVEPGQAQMACLKQHKDELSAACKQKLMSEAEKRREQQKQEPAPTPPQP